MKRLGFTALCVAVILPGVANARPSFNKNQALDRDEFLSVQSARFDKFDADHDGALTQSEYIAGRLAEFDKADRNGDGTLARGEARGLESSGELVLQRSGVEANAAKTFAKVAPGGEIAKEDYLNASGAAFDKADKDGDGLITRGEARGLTKI